jgi:hypothetical protein
VPKFDKWSNQPVRLFHGTTRVSAEQIYQQVDPFRGRKKTDFGCGFYTTSWFEQARDWAIFLSTTTPGGSPAVITFEVDRLAFSVLETLCFVRGAVDAHDYWALVNHCRKGGCHYASNNWYDIVVGPVAAFPWRRRKTHLDYDQISFHSPKATAILDSSQKEIVDVN